MDAPPPPIRRVVTGFVDGAAAIVTDSAIERVSPPAGSHQTMFSPLWGTLDAPTRVPAAADGATTLGKNIVNPRGSTLRVIDTGPQSSSPMHRTLSLDYIIVLAGEIVLELPDRAPVTLKVGDIVVQQGTLHTWHNRTDQWARFAAVCLGADVVDGPTSDEGLLP